MDKRQLDLIGEYYDKTGYLFRWFYYDKESLGIHAGLWEEGTSSARDALTNVYREICRIMNPRRGQIILDAGCGVGGASLWLAKNTEAQYVGITLSSKQAKEAEKFARERNLNNKTSFCVGDFHKTDFPNEKFDAVFFIESSCHADLDDLAKETRRIMKPKGTLVIVDWASPRTPGNPYERKMADYFCRGFRLPKWLTRHDYLTTLSKSGFRNITFIDKTREIRKTVQDLYLKTYILGIPLGLLRLVRLISRAEFENLFATYSQKHLYDMELFRYGIYVAEKSG